MSIWDDELGLNRPSEDDFLDGLPADIPYEYDIRTCQTCGGSFTNDEAFQTGEEWLCRKCAEVFVADALEEAEEFAEQHCCVDPKPFPDYDSELEFRCSPDDYANGDRESYSPNAYFSHLRHDHSNYESLIEDLDRDLLSDKINYAVIRYRIECLILQRLKEDEGKGAEGK